jgi:uncharacterized membrane protein YjjB (DUF3815 family)
MPELFVRIFKPLVLAVISFFSLSYLGLPTLACTAIAAIPLVLGLLSIMTSFVYSLAGLSFIAAAFSTLIPSQYSNAVDFATKLATEVRQSQQTGKNLKPATTAPALAADKQVAPSAAPSASK